MRVEIVSIGTELLLGTVTDTNSGEIARALAGAGLDVFHTTVVGDNERRIAHTLGSALGRADLVLATGGLGPTVDDVTREAVARLTGRPLDVHPRIEARIRRRFAANGLRYTDNNRRQAMIPRGARVIPNPVGTAPGFVVAHGTGQVVCLPGVPSEMRHLMARWVIPWLRRTAGLRTIVSRSLTVIGMTESGVDEALADLLSMGPNPTVGITAREGVLELCVTASATTPAAARRLIAPVCREIERRIGRQVVEGASGPAGLASVVVGLLTRARRRLALAEQGTGGEVARRLCAAGAGDRTLVMACTLGSRGLAAIDGDAHGAGRAARPWASRDAAPQAARWVCTLARADVGMAVVARRERLDGGQVRIAITRDGAVVRVEFRWVGLFADLEGRIAQRCLEVLRRTLEGESPRLALATMAGAPRSHVRDRGQHRW